MYLEIIHWKDDKRALVLASFTDALTRLRALGVELGQDKHFLARIDRQLERLRKPDLYSLDEIRCEFSIPRTDGSSWDNSVRVCIELDEDYSAKRKARENKELKRGETRFKVKVECGMNGSSGYKAQDTARLGRMLIAVSGLVTELELDMDIMLRRLGHAPDDLEKVKAAEALSELRYYVRGKLNTVEGSYHFRNKVRDFADEVIAKFCKQDDGTLVTEFEHRFDPKERKLLNKVPSTVFKVTHRRGGPSTVRLTKKAIACIEQLMKDEAEKAAKEAAEKAAA